MGLANLVPGVSGGTMLLAMGIYPDFISAVADVPPRPVTDAEGKLYVIRSWHLLREVLKDVIQNQCSKSPML